MDAENSIKYANTTEEGLHISINSIHIDYETSDNEFGLLKEGANITLEGIMKRVELRNLREVEQDHYGWQLTSYPTANGKPVIFRNVYLDAPADDENAFGILGLGGRIFCLPIRTDSKKYLFCLLLQLLGGGSGNFRRVGLTKIPPYISRGHHSSEDLLLSRPKTGDELVNC